MAAAPPRLLRDVRRRPVLRAVDTWMEAARKAEKPDAMQRRLRAVCARPALLDRHRESALPGGRSRVTLQFDGSTVTLIVEKTPTGCRVVSVRR